MAICHSTLLRYSRRHSHSDEPWNLVLTYNACNTAKSDHLPGVLFIEQLISRNEVLIASNHPLRQHITQQLGTSPTQRRRTVEAVYQNARVVIPWVWTGLPGFESASSMFYRMLVQGLAR